MKCVKCGVELPGDANFCKECKAPQRLVCKKCGSSVLTDAKFCLNCGGSDFTPPDGGPETIKNVNGW
jgi:ribosomal protein L40E